MAEERRRHFRKASLIPVAYATEGKSRKDHILNISSGGVFIGTQDETSCGSEILMSFVHPDARRDLSIVGRIAWVSSDGIGVRFKRLAEKGIDAVAFGRVGGTAYGIQITPNLEEIQTINTVSLYMNPERQKAFYQSIIRLKPERVIFNPGTENPEFYPLLREAGINVEEACTLVLLGTGTY